MPDSNSTTSNKVPELTTYTALITAVAIALGAWKLFEPKLERIRAVRNEVGQLEFGFRFFYVFPQYFLIIISMGLVCFLALVFIDSLHPGTLSTVIPKDVMRAVLVPVNIIWVVFLLGALGAVIYWNLVSRILMGVAWLLSLAPIPGLQNRFGSRGESLGWHQAAAVMEGPDKGQPLLVDDEGIERIAWGVLAKIDQNAGAEDYAAEPEKLSTSEKANIALFGCIIEANFYAQRWPSPSWAQFYAGLVDIQRTNPIFAPAQLLAFQSGQAFFEAFRNRLDEALTARNQPRPPDRALAAAADISRAWESLKARANGDLLQLIPRFAPCIGGRMAWLDRRLRDFPQLNSDGMRPQLIKLLVRWNTLPVSAGVFVQPFAKRQAWLLLQYGALRALPEMKEVTFHSTGQVSIARIAALRVIRRVGALIEEGASSEALAAASKLGSNTWTRLETADFILWSWARAEASQAVKDVWDKTKWRWKFEDDRIQRVA